MSLKTEASKALFFVTRDEWRHWLAQNHEKEKGAWLIHYKKKSGKKSVSHEDAVEEALCFGWIDGKLKRIDEEKFMLNYSSRKPKSVWSKINKEKAEKLIASGKMTAAGLLKIKEARKNGYWDAAYTNLIKDEIPPDLEKALRDNPDAWDNFQNFANSYQNMYIGWINNARTEQTRQRRLKEVVRRSHLNQKT